MELSELLQKIVDVFEQLQIPYLVTGSVASMAYGEPRLTNGIDVVAEIRQQHVKTMIDLFPEEGFYISEDMIRDAIRRGGQFNIIHPASGLKVDVIIKRDTPFDNSALGEQNDITRGNRTRPISQPPKTSSLKKWNITNMEGPRNTSGT